MKKYTHNLTWASGGAVKCDYIKDEPETYRYVNFIS